jgi:putative SOS response-associated peptidase YedK
MAAVHPRMPVVVAEHLHRDWLANETVEAEKALRQVLSHPDPTLIVEPVELERRTPVPKPLPAEADQLTLF